ncbi:MAG: YjjG family noncanonical pyrimidine nucleotidase [Cyclobacteriaceae bacterium]|nr:YjjG family noncanonical pyrimidine nucleotidase [Cyclobacteriaceae bacterium]
MAVIKKHIIFDLDDTLWDYKNNSREALLELCDSYKLNEEGIDHTTFLETFRTVNHDFWQRFDEGIINRETIRKERFPTVFEKLSLNPDGVALRMQDDFMKICPAKPRLVKGARNVLEYLNGKYALHILSNGFDEIQYTKLEAAGIRHYFDKVITSGRAGFRKPQPEIFEFAVNEIGTTKEDCIMIGDNPGSDIEGAYYYGMDQVYFNTHNKECDITPNHTIERLEELLQLF